MRRYKRTWTSGSRRSERDDDEHVPEVEDKMRTMPLPACEGKTIRYDGGALAQTLLPALNPRVAHGVAHRVVQVRANAPQAVSERRFITSTGAYGYCVRCSLLVRAPSRRIALLTAAESEPAGQGAEASHGSMREATQDTCPCETNVIVPMSYR